MQVAELIGYIIDVPSKGYGPNKKAKVAYDFKVFTPESKKTYTCKCGFFCPVQPGDKIYAKCELDSTRPGEITIIEPPFVQVGTDKPTLVQTFARAVFGLCPQKAGLLHDKLHEGALLRNEFKSHPDKVALYLHHLAILWHSSQDTALIGAYANILKPEMMTKLLEFWYRKFSMRRLYLMGLTNKDIYSCKMPLQEIYEACCQNPYRLFTLPIEKCSSILRRQNREPTVEDLQTTQIARHVYTFQMQKGWTGTPTGLLLKIYPHLPQFIERLKRDYSIVTELQTVYLPYPYKVETKLGHIIEMLLARPQRVLSPDLKLPEHLSADQKEAVIGALKSPFSIICGGAGTGKTTVIKTLIELNEKCNLETMPASFTGKAVSRIREVIGRRAPSTLHRMIVRKQEVKEFKHLIIDETSMVTQELLYEFMETFGTNYQITLIGDPNQLPPIGWGSLLSELLKAPIPVFRLTQNHRFIGNQEDGISINATRLLAGPAPPDEDDFDPYADNEPKDMFQFAETANFRLLKGGTDLVEHILEMFKTKGLTPDQVQVITPYVECVDQLNILSQKVWDAGEPRVMDGRGKTWRVNDRVMMLENNYDINIFNGETGIVIEVNGEQITVQFDATENKPKHAFLLKSKYPPRREEEADDLEMKRKKELTVELLGHCYAVSAHKSQGSESSHVIVYIPEGKRANEFFLNRNLVYVMITRAKESFFAIGDMIAFSKAALRPLPKRVEKLAQRLTQKQLQLVS